MPWSPPASELLSQSVTAAAVMGWTPPDAPIAPVPADLPSRTRDYTSQILHGLGRGAAAIPGFAGDIPTMAGAGLEWLGGRFVPETTAGIAGAVRPITSLLTPPTSAETVGFAERNLIGERPTPQSPGARAAGDIAQYVPGAMIPLGGGATTANIARQGLLGALSGGAAVGAREAGLPPAAQFAAGLVPGLASSGANLLSGRTGAGGLVRQATRELSPEDWQRAQQLQTTAREVGVPLLGSEALAPRVGPGAIGQLASDVKATSRGAPIINPVFEQRPAAITAAVKRATAPLGPASSADDVLTNVQTTAQRAIDAAVKERTRVTDPLYRAATPIDVPEEAVAGIISNIDSAVADVGAKSDIGKALTSLRGKLMTEAGPETNTGHLNTVYKELRDSLAMSPEMGGAARSHVGVLSPIASQIDDALRTHNPTYATASDLYQRMSGPVTFLSGEPGGPAALYRRIAEAPNNEALRRLMLDPENVSPETVATIGTLFNNNPKALAAWTRHYLENALDKTSKRLQSGDNPALGANWSNLVAGTPQTRGVLDAYLQQVDPSGGAQRGLGRLLDVLERTAKTPGTGSPTAQRLQLGESLGGGPASTVAQIGAGAVMASTGIPAGQLAGGYLVAGGIFNQIRRAYLNLGSAKIARALTAPDAVGKLRSLARKDPGTPAAATAVLGILGGRAEAEKE